MWPFTRQYFPVQVKLTDCLLAIEKTKENIEKLIRLAFHRNYSKNHEGTEFYL